MKTRKEDLLQNLGCTACFLSNIMGINMRNRDYGLVLSSSLRRTMSEGNQYGINYPVRSETGVETGQ
ncbi:hypothetical protein GCM10008014_46150 [Paenibacillus silvae]|uniref:Uncharacterized protein n=1 Tax=Paenibacillus silvae TaxID=1325358 RepID=A0ABQ1ZJR8_9BACL|nr:hypothetical protein GCM10008014_46150 [Paenibacillus silvae]